MPTAKIAEPSVIPGKIGAVGRKNCIGDIKLPIGTHDAVRREPVLIRDAWAVFSISPYHGDMALFGQDFDEAASDCSKRRIHQLFAANGGDQI